jgi:mycothione reductase
VRKAEAAPAGKKLTAVDRYSKKGTEIIAEEILVATGRAPNTDILHPEKAGIETDLKGFIKADEYMQTSQPNIWVLGDADGKFLFKHVANHEARIVYFNAVLNMKAKMDYHAVPHAVFTDPEIASVALREQGAVEKYGKDKILIGFYKYADTAKGEAMALKDDFVKVIIKKDTGKILGAHIIGPEASVLIQEIVNLMYTGNQNLDPITEAMHIHPALSEVVARAFQTLMIPDQYHHFLEEHSGLPLE